MKGGIYQDKKRAGQWIVKFPGIWKRFSDKTEGERFLNMVRYKYDEGTLDAREFKGNRPLGFTTQSTKWLDRRTKEVKAPCDLKRHIVCAQKFFGQRNIKELMYGDIEEFIDSLPAKMAAKTKHNYLTTVHSFWGWLIKRNEVPITQIQSFPEIKFTLAWRNTVTKDVQQDIINEVKRISYDINPKIWIGIKWLSTYIAIRPIEMIGIKEEDFDFQMGAVNVKHNKVDKPKIVAMLPEDLEMVKTFPPSMPHMYFFRHGIRKGVRKENRGQFGKDYLWKWWTKACKNLGIKGVDMYGGTRHSSAKALRNNNRPDEIKRGTMHDTNAAFERYFQVELEDARKIYRQTSGNQMATRKTGTNKAQVIDLFK
jgi:integrase